MEVIRVQEKCIGDGCPCFIAAEVGVNHNGDMDLAHRMIDSAAQAGADGVKFQNYYVEEFITDRSLMYEYTVGGQTVREPQYDMFKRYQLQPEVLDELASHCRERGVVFFSTPMSVRGLDDLVQIGVPLLKNGSDCLNHLPLVRAMGRSGLPTVLSTGMATLGEIDTSVRAFEEGGGRQLVLVHCTSTYPTPPDEMNLRSIPTLRTAFGYPTGLSDHSYGVVAAVGAVALGACFIEKHFTLDKAMHGPDHRFSADPDELCALVDAVRTLESNLGDGRVGPEPSEMESRRQFRMSLAAACDLPEGHRMCPDDLTVRRPGDGFPPNAQEFVVGAVLKRSVTSGQVLRRGDLG